MKNMAYFIKAASLGMVCVFTICGCSGKYNEEKERERLENIEIKNMELKAGNGLTKAIEEGCFQEIMTASEITEVDWSEYFDGLQGAAVIYDASDRRYTIYNSDIASARRSPCSTFKIISSLIALENGILQPDKSIREWSGETFWNEKWNQDMGFRDAFHESCVWYFRELANEIGQEQMQEELDKLMYGNCDISDWEGRLNTNNDNRALTGFWLESSLAISPKEQTEVMERIFGEHSAYSKETKKELKEVMLVEQDKADYSIYGKTGMGKSEGITVDAWFTGFAEGKERTIYFCVYLGRTDSKDVTSAAAKEIAIQLLGDYDSGSMNRGE